VTGYLVLIAFYMAGEALASVTGLPVPGAMVGLLLLLATAVVRGGLPETVASAGMRLLHHLPLLLLPIGVGVMGVGAVAESLPVLLATLGAALMAGVVLTASVMLLVLRRS
jgi:putative effector of murein hydrolase LrgA (UPF0299 family)